MLRSYRTPKGTDLPLLDLRGKEYLEVKYRVVWFREEHPTWRIETEFISVTADSAMAKATIKDENGNTLSTSHKFEDKKGFPDFAEKAETGAIGRAIALLGFGTQFCADELDEGDRIVDSPTEPKAPASKPKLEAVSGVGSDQTIGFGKYAKLTAAEAIARDGLPKLQDYAGWLEDQAADKGQPLAHGAAMLVNAVKHASMGGVKS